MNLLLLTSYFPYSGEPFLEGEITILAEHFDEILIVPLHVVYSAGEKLPEWMPANAQTYRFTQKLTIGPKLLKGVMDHGIVRSISQITESAIHGRCFDLRNIASLCYQYFQASAWATHLMKQIDLSKFDVFYSYWGGEVGLCLSILRQTSTLSRKALFVSRVHGYDIYAERTGRKWLPFQKRILESCDLVAPCSEQGEKYLKFRYPRLSDKIHHYHLGVQSQSILNGGSHDEVLRIVTCSNMLPIKRLELLATALMRLERLTIWTHIGDGPEEDKIVSLAAKFPCHIKFVLMGRTENSGVIEYYRTNPVDVFVNVSSSEGVPVSIMEALSFGIEPIVTDVGGVAELVRPDFGTLLPVNFNLDELAYALQNYHRSDERRRKAQLHQQQHFSIQNFRTFISGLKV